MTLIASVFFLIAGAGLAIIATGKFSSRDPYGLIPYFLGDFFDFDFTAYLLRSVGYFLLFMATATAQPILGFWALILLLIGAIPSLMMTREHNRRVRRMWRRSA